ncbi:MucBP domain-containing protein [uncultured Lactobacillus sp.]|uniref:MucBP domain-containing protein n=1 Tax=uncultured Lactobacillus sp. TaxID=153152 RepID=UPI0025CCF5D1|nr:MucBP domain-containing protein [uncultured Lactobacillus sp.]
MSTRTSELKSTIATSNFDIDAINSIENSNSIASWMPDKVLQKIVAANLNQNISQITKESLANLTEIKLIAPSERHVIHGERQCDVSAGEYRLRLKITSLEGLEYATNLAKIDLAPSREFNHKWLHHTIVNSTLTDISALHDLNKLTSVNLEMCSVHDISALANKPQLIQLNLSYNAIADFSPLKTNKRLLENGSVNLKKQIIRVKSIHIPAESTFYTLDPYKLFDFNGSNMPLKIETGKHLNSSCFIKQFCSNWSNHVGQITDEQTVTWNLLGLKPGDGAAMTVKFHSMNHVQEPLITGWYIIPFRIVTGQPITFHFKDDDGNTIACEQKLYGDINTSSNISIPSFTGYSIAAKLVDGIKTPISQDFVTTTISAKVQDITLLYNRDKPKNITIHYQDENGKTIAPESITSGDFNQQKVIEPKDVPGYTPIYYEIDHNGNSYHLGSIAIPLNSQPQDITFYYDKKSKEKVSNVIVRFEDMDGNKIAPNKIISGFINDQQSVPALKLPDYTIKFKDFNGSHITNNLDTTVITLKQQSQKLIYVYTKSIAESKSLVKTDNTTNYKHSKYNYKHSKYQRFSSKIHPSNDKKTREQQPSSKINKLSHLVLTTLILIVLFNVLGLVLMHYKRKRTK